MKLHLMIGDAFGGVESVFYHLINSNDLPNNNHIYFLGNVPNQFYNLPIKSILIDDLTTLRNRKVEVFVHCDFKAYWELLLIYFYVDELRINIISHGRLLYASKNYFIWSLLFCLKLINNLIADKKVAISELSANDNFWGEYSVIPYEFDGRPVETFYVSKSRRLRLLNVGRFHKSLFFIDAKNQSFLINLFNEIGKHIDCELTFVGGGYPKEFTNRKGIKVIEYVENIEEMFYQNDMLLMPSKHESFCQTFYLGQIYGITCIGSKNIPDEAIYKGRGIRLNLNVDTWKKYILKKENDLSYKRYGFEDLKRNIYKKYIKDILNESSSNC